MAANPERCRKYRQRLRERAMVILCGLFPHCKFCQGTTKLEMAHVIPTNLDGPSRGMDRRYRDVIANPGCYVLLCHDCHREFDRRGRR